MPDTVTINADDIPKLQAMAKRLRKTASAAADGSANGALRQHIDRVLRLKAEIGELQADVAAVYATAKADGYDKKAMARLVQVLLADEQELREQDELLELYRRAYFAAGGDGAETEH